jgi:hypothetical protein
MLQFLLRRHYGIMNGGPWRCHRGGSVSVARPEPARRSFISACFVNPYPLSAGKDRPGTLLIGAAEKRGANMSTLPMHLST